MSSPYFVLLRFEDSKKTPYVVSSRDIKSFHPVHSSDFDAKEVYDVLWQESTESFDGYFDAKITCMAGEYRTVYVFYDNSKCPCSPKVRSVIISGRT